MPKLTLKDTAQIPHKIGKHVSQNFMIETAAPLTLLAELLAPKGKKSSGRAREKIDVPRINSGHGRAPPRTRLLASRLRAILRPRSEADRGAGCSSSRRLVVPMRRAHQADREPARSQPAAVRASVSPPLEVPLSDACLCGATLIPTRSASGLAPCSRPTAPRAAGECRAARWRSRSRA